MHRGAGALGEDLGDDVGHGAAGLAEGGGESFPAIQQHDDARQPARRQGGCPLFGDVSEPARGEQFLPPFQLGAEPGDQPGGSFGLGPGDHRAAVRQVGQRQQRAVAAVDSVDVRVGATGTDGDRGGDGAQQLGAARPRRARCHQVAEGIQVQHRGPLPLLTRKINEAERR